jgi:hypothetical protein
MGLLGFEAQPNLQLLAIFVFAGLDFHCTFDRNCIIGREDCTAPAPRTQFPNHAEIAQRVSSHIVERSFDV